MESSFVDDFGTSVFRSLFHGLLWADKARWVGSYYPGSKGRKVIPLYWDHKAEIRAFNENDINCNTCTHLVRTKHNKCSLGWLKGVCSKKDIPIQFHPEDSMFPVNESCYTHRE